MKAKDAAEHVIKHPELSTEQIKKLIPAYPNKLHTRQWIHTFLKTLPQGMQANYRQGLFETTI